MSRRYKIWLLASLYAAQGLPYGFFTQALPVLLRDAGLSLSAAIADVAGYAPTFMAGFVLSAAGCLALVASLDASRGPQRLRQVWNAA